VSPQLFLIISTIIFNALMDTKDGAKPNTIVFLLSIKGVGMMDVALKALPRSGNIEIIGVYKFLPVITAI